MKEVSWIVAYMAIASSNCASDSNSGSELDELDADSAALVDVAPFHTRIGEALQQCVPSLPAELHALLSKKGARVAASHHIKTSFHRTFFAELSPSLVEEGMPFHRVIIQVMGAQLGDKALFGQLSAANLVRATELASRAGVRVPKILAVDQCDTEIGMLDYVVEEYIDSQTIEDEVCAPMDQWHRIAGEVRSKLCRNLLTVDEGGPLPSFENATSYLQWLLDLVPPWDVKLKHALSNYQDDLLLERPVVCPPVLLHQDLNAGNLLCSEDAAGAWALDAVIDWESAAVADPFALSDEDPWRTIQQFALVVKGSALADRYVKGTLPRCELRELVCGYDEAAHEMEDAGVLKYEPWAARVELARSAGTSN